MVNKMKISIVMATYNGELYIEKQLASICNQTVPPDEIIISDDRSSDNTISIIKSFINKNNIAQKTNIYVNNTQLGFAKNFLNAINIFSSILQYNYHIYQNLKKNFRL